MDSYVYSYDKVNPTGLIGFNMYSGKNRIYFTLGYLISRPLLSKFDSNSQQVTLVNGTALELFNIGKPAKLHAVCIVADGKRQIGIDSG